MKLLLLLGLFATYAVVQAGPGAVFLTSVRQRLAALHLQLSQGFRTLAACKDRDCRIAARRTIRGVKRSELLIRRARGHIRLGRLFRNAANCQTNKCRRDIRRQIRKEQRRMRRLIRRGASARARAAAQAARRLRRVARRAARRARRARLVAHHLNKGRNAARRARFLHLATHFRGLGLLYAEASSCQTERCTRRALRRIRAFRAAQRAALARLQRRGVRESLRHARTSARRLRRTQARRRRLRRREARRSIWSRTFGRSVSSRSHRRCSNVRRAVRRAHEAVAASSAKPADATLKAEALRLARFAIRLRRRCEDHHLDIGHSRSLSRSHSRGLSSESWGLRGSSHARRLDKARRAARKHHVAGRRVRRAIRRARSLVALAKVHPESRRLRRRAARAVRRAKAYIAALKAKKAKSSAHKGQY